VQAPYARNALCRAWAFKSLRGCLVAKTHLAWQRLPGRLQHLCHARRQVKKWCSVFVVAGAITVCASVLQQYGFASAGMELTRRLRVLLLSTLLRQVCVRLRPLRSLSRSALPQQVSRRCAGKARERGQPTACWPRRHGGAATAVRARAQEVAFFDAAENASGAQSARLAVDTAAIRGAVGDQLGALTQEIVTFIGGALPARLHHCVIWATTTGVLALHLACLPRWMLNFLQRQVPAVPGLQIKS
jgi:hypothetical protein